MKLWKKLWMAWALLAAASVVSASDLFEGRVFVMNLGDSEIGLHPQETQSATEGQIFSGLYEGLVVYDPQTLQPLPGAASRWEFSDSQRTLTFHLRGGLTFSDGTPLTARDFYQSFLRLLTPENQAPFSFLLDDVMGASEYRLGLTKNPARLGIQVPDEKTIVFRLRTATPHFLSILCHYSLSPLHPQTLSRKVSPDRFIGNGPYVLAEASEKILVLKKNDRYWDREKVAISEVQILRLPDSKEATELFRRGTIDWLSSGIDFSQPIHDDSQVISAMYASSYLYFRTEQKVYKDPLLRKALVLLLPLESLRKGQALPSANLIPQIDPYPVVKGVEKTNIELGLKILKEAGYEKGSGLPPLQIYLPDSEDSTSLAQMLMEGWKSQLPTLEVIYTPVPWREYYRNQSKTKHDIGFQSWIGDFPDPLSFLSMWETGSSLNAYLFSDKTYDALLENSRTQTGKERLETLSKAEEYLLTSGAIIPLGFSISINIIDKSSIGGWYPNPFDIHPFKNLFFTAPRSLPGIVYLTH